MLKNIIYLNIIVIFVMSFFYVLNAGKNKKQLIIEYIIFDVITIIICLNGIVEIGWDGLLILPVLLLSLLIYLITLYRINKILKKEKIKTTSQKAYSPVLIISVLLLVFSYFFELFVINNCDYLLRYNYQEGFINSEDTYIAIIYDKPITITLLKNIFNRQGKLITGESYNIKYNSDSTISISNYKEKEIDNKIIRRIAEKAKNKCADAREAEVEYLPNGKYAIITLSSIFNHGVGINLEEQFYAKGKYIKSIKTKGSLESITHYE